MRIVIDIPNELYNSVLNETYCGSLYEELKNGIVLPKGHGRLIDGDKLFSDMQNGIYAGLYEEGYEEYGHILNMDDCLEEVEAADTIIQADKEVE